MSIDGVLGLRTPSLATVAIREVEMNRTQVVDRRVLRFSAGTSSLTNKGLTFVHGIGQILVNVSEPRWP